jgi:hypothetical protein
MPVQPERPPPRPPDFSSRAVKIFLSSRPMQNGNSTSVRKRADLSQSKLRSAITNGSALLSDLDHRGAWARRLRDLLDGITADLGGSDVVSEATKVLVRRAAMITLQLELMEQHFADQGGEATTHQIEIYQRASGALRRLLECLGLERKAKDVTPVNEDRYRKFIAAYEAAEAAEAAE